MLSWIYLSISIFFEVAGTLSLKYSSENDSPFWGGAVVVFYIISFSLMWIAIKKIDISVSYAVWAGLGTTLVVFGGWILFKEPMTILKLFFVSLIIIGIVGLKYLSKN
ncbi:cation/cationic drug transporter [Thiovulum sp. ES]|nr:cation/cationic drug transporter [Thiovulum sp. ES]